MISAVITVAIAKHTTNNMYVLEDLHRRVPYVYGLIQLRGDIIFHPITVVEFGEEVWFVNKINKRFKQAKKVGSNSN